MVQGDHSLSLPAFPTPTRVLASVVLAAGLLVGGCGNALEGGASGAGLGALAGLGIGSLFGEAGTGAAIGAISGGVAGAVIGDQNQRADQRGYQQSNAW